MNLLWFIIKIKLYGFLKPRKGSGWLNLFFVALVGLITIANAFVTSLTFKYLTSHKNIPYSTLIFYLNMLIGISIIAKNYFPNYSVFKFFFLKTHPVRNYIKASLQLIFDLFSGFYFITILFVTVISFIDNNYDFYHWIISVLSILFFFILNRTLSLLESGKGSKSFYYISLFLICSTCAFDINLLRHHNAWTIWGLILLITVSCCFFGYSYNIDAKRQYEANYALNGKSYNLNKLLFTAAIKRKQIVVPLLIALFFKLLLIAVTLGINKKVHLSIENNLFIFAVLFAPVFPYSYAFNNTWGVLPPVFLITGYTATIKDMFKHYLFIVYRFVLIDFLLSVLLSLYILHSPLYLLVQCVTSLNALVFGFLCSAFFPKKAQAAFDISSTKTNTAVGASLFLVLLSVSFYFVAYNLILITISEAIVMMSLCCWARYYSKKFNFINTGVLEKIF